MIPVFFRGAKIVKRKQIYLWGRFFVLKWWFIGIAVLFRVKSSITQMTLP